jgi:hypothetical protein
MQKRRESQNFHCGHSCAKFALQALLRKICIAGTATQNLHCGHCCAKICIVGTAGQKFALWAVLHKNLHCRHSCAKICIVGSAAQNRVAGSAAQKSHCGQCCAKITLQAVLHKNHCGQSCAKITLGSPVQQSHCGHCNTKNLHCGQLDRYIRDCYNRGTVSHLSQAMLVQLMLYGWFVLFYEFLSCPFNACVLLCFH